MFSEISPTHETRMNSIPLSCIEALRTRVRPAWNLMLQYVAWCLKTVVAVNKVSFIVLVGEVGMVVLKRDAIEEGGRGERIGSEGEREEYQGLLVEETDTPYDIGEFEAQHERRPLLRTRSSSNNIINIDIGKDTNSKTFITHPVKAEIWDDHESLLFTVVAMVSVASLQFGSQVAYNSISALAPFFKQENGFTSEDIAALYSAYHLPNLVMVLMGGILSDRIGAGVASILFSSIVVTGTFVVYMSYPDINGMILGRFIFGIGSETLSVIQLSLCNRWFSKGFYLPLATSFALCDVSNRLGSIFAFAALSHIAETSMSSALFVVLCTILFSFMMSLVVYLVDQSFTRSNALKTDSGAPLPSFSTLFRSISSFSPAFWVLLTVCITFYSSIVTFTDFSVDFFHENFNLNAHEGGKLTSSITIICLFMGPLAAFTADHMGYRLIFILLGVCCILPAHVLFAFPSLLGQPSSPLLPCLLLGFALTLVAASLWCSLAIVIPNWAMSSGMGLAVSLQNGGLFLTPLLVGYIRDSTGHYAPALTVFIVLDLVAFATISALVVFRKEIGGARILRRPTKLAVASKTIPISF